MRAREKERLIEAVGGVSSDVYGEPLYLRPYEQDDKLIAELARALGVKKAQIAQKLLHLALRDKTIELPNDKRQAEKLDWLIGREKHRAVQDDLQTARLERLEEHARQLERLIERSAENTRFVRVLTGEIFCITSVCMSYLNQIFRKLIEYLSPNEVEQKNSADFADRNILGLIEHSLVELEKIGEHHNLDLSEVEPEMLYLFTKIEKIKQRLLPPGQ